MIPTPDLSHLTAKDFEEVYEPAEDTFILLDALEKDTSLRSRNHSVCLEIGSGSGCVSTFLAQMLGSGCSLYLCTDINPHASRCTVHTGNHNGVNLDSITMSLCDSFTRRLARQVDVLIFNPPYVPTVSYESDEAQRGQGIQSSWAGGCNGMEVTNRLLELVGNLLSERGVFYLVAVKQNNVEKLRQEMEQRRLRSEVILQRRAGREHLFVIKFERS